MNQVTIDIKEKQILNLDGKTYKVLIEEISKDKCICGCGEPRTTSKSKYASATCRTRYYRSKL